MTTFDEVKGANASPDVPDANVYFENDAESVFDPFDEEITAYLDDELTEEERLDFERRLESNPELKERFERHRSAWNALDLLVDVESNVDVTESTVQRLNSETQSELAELNERKRRRSRLFLSVCAGAFCAFVGLGYFLSGLILPDVQKQRVIDKNVVNRLAQLEAIGDFEYLVELSQADFFTKRPKDPFPHKSTNTSSNITSEKTIDERSYEELSQDRSFYRLQQRFERLDESTRKRWRLLWQKIETAPNKELLLKTLDDYSEWLTNFANDEERERLQTENISERIAEVRRKNEELARFWDRFPLRPLSNGNNGSISAENRNKAQSRDNLQPFAPDDSAPSSPFATQMFMLRNLLPEELRGEDFRSVYQKYELFRTNNNFEEKDADGILEFLKADSNVFDSLSEDAKKYLVSLPEDERRSALSLITALCVAEKNAIDYYRQNAFHRPSEPDDFRSNPFERFARRQNVSIRELANDLRNTDSNVRDYITSRPSQEAQALLFGLHWGGGKMKLGFPQKTSTSITSFHDAPLELQRSRQKPPQNSGFSPSDNKAPAHTRQNGNIPRP